MIISVDGPAGSGKQLIAKYIAKNYHFYHLDSGILYRRLAKTIIDKKINYNNFKELTNYINTIKNLSSRSHLSLRKESISIASSKIASIPIIRNFIDKKQKDIVRSVSKKHKGCVIDGRDIGSKVFKNAKIKLYINVDTKIRAKRRHKQLIGQGERAIYAEILKEIKLRDNKDKNRKHSPLVIPKGAIIIDNSSNFKITEKQIKKVLTNI